MSTLLLVGLVVLSFTTRDVEQHPVQSNRSARDSSPTIEAGSTESSKRSPAGVDEGEVDVDGRLVLEGIGPDEIDGALIIAEGSAMHWLPPRTVSVRQGRWTLRAIPASYLCVYDISAAGRRWPARHAMLTVPESGPVVVAGTRHLDYEVRIVHAVGGMEFTEVDLVPYFGNDTAPPQTRPHVARGGRAAGRPSQRTRAPIQFRDHGPGEYLVTAPGVSWSLLRLSPAHACPAVVELYPAGGLVIQARHGGELLRTGQCRVRLIEASSATASEPAYEFELPASGALRVDKLDGGEYRVLVVHAPSGCKPRSLGETTATVVPGDVGEVVLDLGAPGMPADACRTTGFIYSSFPEVELPEVEQLLIEPVDAYSIGGVRALRLRMGTDGLRRSEESWAWDAGPLAPGEYRARLLPQGIISTFIVPVAAEHVVSIVIPSGHKQEVAIRWEGTEDPADLEAVWIHQADAESDLVGLAHSGRALASDNPFQFTAWGKYAELWVRLRDGRHRRVRLDLRGVDQHAVILRPEFRFVLALEALGGPYPVAPSWWGGISVDPLPGTEGGFLGFDLGPEVLRHRHASVEVRVDSAGSYRVRFARIHELQANPAEMTIRMGPADVGPTEHRVDLTAALCGASKVAAGQVR